MSDAHASIRRPRRSGARCAGSCAPGRPQGHPQLSWSSPISSSAPITSPARSPRRSRSDGAQLIGFPGCYPSDYAHRVMEAICTHPNVGAVLLVSLGCEEFRRERARARRSRRSGRPVELLVIQDCGGTARDRSTPAAPGSRRSSPSSAAAADRADRLRRPRHRHQMRRLRRAQRHHRQSRRRPRLRPAGRRRRHGDVRGDLRADRLRGPHGRPRRHAGARRRDHRAPCARPTPITATSATAVSAAATSSTASRRIEEKSLGAYAKSGTRPIGGLLKPGDPAAASGPLSDGHGQ